MTKREKTEQRIMSRPIRTDITFDEVRDFLISKGFVMKAGKGDHVKFIHPDLPQHLSIPCAVKTLNPCYIILVQKAVKQI